jgi:hypothetical protein
MELAAAGGGSDPTQRIARLDEAYRTLGLTASDVVVSYAHVVGELLRAILEAPAEAMRAASVDVAVELVRAAFLDCELAICGEVQRLEARLKIEAARRRTAEAGRLRPS